MATKNISITEDAYDRLARLRKKNESFSEIIIEITGRVKLSDFHGILSKDFADEIKSNIEKSREINRKLHEKRNAWIKEAFR